MPNEIKEKAEQIIKFAMTVLGDDLQYVLGLTIYMKEEQAVHNKSIMNAAGMLSDQLSLALIKNICDIKSKGEII